MYFTYVIRHIHTFCANMRDIPKDLGSNPGECLIFYLFRCVLSFSATLAKRWNVPFRLGLAKDTQQH